MLIELILSGKAKLSMATCIFILLWRYCLTMYSLLNSCSAKESLLSSQLSSKAVRIGSLLDKAIREGLARARYELILDLSNKRIENIVSENCAIMRK